MSRPDDTPRPESFASVFDEAAAEVRERILRDAKRFDGDAPAVAFVEYLADHLFDTGLDVDTWRRACQLPRRAYLRLVEELGPLKPYLDDLRVAVASRLVLETGADLSELGRRVGYEVPRTFRRAFERRHGKSPHELRAARSRAALSRAALSRSPQDPSSVADVTEAGAAGTAEDDVPPAAEAELSLRVQAARWRRRFALGLFDRRQAAELRRLLRRKYPRLEEEAEGESGGPALPPWVRLPMRILSTDRLGWFAAECVVGRAIALPDPEMRRTFLHGIRFGDLSGFYVLHNVAFHLLGHDARKAVAVAELAVELVGAHPEKRPGDHADWRALAWATLGNVRLNAGDRASADAAFVHARAEWETPREKTGRHQEAQICRHEAALRKVQRRFEETVALLDRVAEIARETDNGGLLVECLLERADVARITGDAATAVEILEQVLAGPLPPMAEEPDGRQEARFKGAVHFFLAKAHTAAGAHDAAAACFEETRRLLANETGHYTAEIDQHEARLCLRTGRLERAESLMRTSRDTFEKKDGFRHGLASAELAGFLAHLGLEEEARAEAEKTAPFFERLPLHREALRAARILRSIPEAEDFDSSRVDELCRCLDVVAREAVSLPSRSRNVDDREGEEVEA